MPNGTHHDREAQRIDEITRIVDDLPALARHWKRYYNTAAGVGTAEQFVASADRRPPGVLA